MSVASPSPAHLVVRDLLSGTNLNFVTVRNAIRCGDDLIDELRLQTDDFNALDLKPGALTAGVLGSIRTARSREVFAGLHSSQDDFSRWIGMIGMTGLKEQGSSFRISAFRASLILGDELVIPLAIASLHDPKLTNYDSLISDLEWLTGQLHADDAEAWSRWWQESANAWNLPVS